MSTITLKNVPPNVHVELKHRAERNRRSVNNEIITCLEEVLGMRSPSPEELIAKAETLQSRIKGRLTQKMLTEFKAMGRP